MYLKRPSLARLNKASPPFAVDPELPKAALLINRVRVPMASVPPTVA